MRRRDGTTHAGSKKACRVAVTSKPALRHPSSPQQLRNAAGPRHRPQSMYKETAAPQEESVAAGGRNACGSAMSPCLDIALSHVADPVTVNEKTSMLSWNISLRHLQIRQMLAFGAFSEGHRYHPALKRSPPNIIAPGRFLSHAVDSLHPLLSG